MAAKFGRYAAAMTLLAVGACGGSASSREGTETTARDVAETSAPETQSSAPQVPQASQQGHQLDLAHLGFDRGSPNAPVRVVEMSDYGCYYCRKFHMETWPVIQKQFVATGKIQWKFLPFVLGMFPNSTQALTASECALEQGSDAFETMNQRLWKDQPVWKKSSDATAVLEKWAGEMGLDVKRYASCVSENRQGDRIAAANAISRRIGVRGTPTFFILGYPPLQGALPTESFVKVLSAVYADAVKDTTR